MLVSPTVGLSVPAPLASNPLLSKCPGRTSRLLASRFVLTNRAGTGSTLFGLSRSTSAALLGGDLDRVH
eukprot:12886771-Prorocentrum_lima.AAC.1